MATIAYDLRDLQCGLLFGVTLENLAAHNGHVVMVLGVYPCPPGTPNYGEPRE